MRKMIYIRAAVFCAALSAQLVAVAQGTFNGSVSVASPNGKVVTVVSVDEPKGSISYEVSKDGKLLVSESALGLTAKVVDFTEGLDYVSQSARKIDESYAMPTGKSAERRNECNELTLNFLKDSKTFSVVFRAYDDGVAYRYKVDGDGELDIVSDASEIILPQLKRCWGQKYADDYSVKYPMREWDEVSSIYGGKNETYKMEKG